MDDRIENMEIQHVYLQKTVEDLSGVVLEQQKEIRELQRTVKMLAEKFQEISLVADVDPNEKPPHY